MNNLKTRDILITDDHRLFADGLGLILSQQDPSLRIATEYNARVLLEDMSALRAYDLLLVDLDMPNINGLDFLRALKSRGENIKVLVISGSENINHVEQALRLGAGGFAPKSLPPKEIHNAINRVLEGKLYLPRSLAESVDWLACRATLNGFTQERDEAPDLTSRKLEVLKEMHKGHSNAQIGVILGISESAVKAHVSGVFKALKTRNRTSAIKVATELGILK